MATEKIVRQYLIQYSPTANPQSQIAFVSTWAFDKMPSSDEILEGIIKAISESNENNFGTPLSKDQFILRFVSLVNFS